MWPKDVEVLRATARMEDRIGQLATAETLYRRAVAVNPQHAGAHNDLGLCLARQGKLEASVQEIEQAIHLQPDKSLYRNNAATVLVELRQDQRALAHLSAVHGPAASSYNLGQLLVQRGRPQDAVAHFQAAIDMDPTMEPARVALAQVTGTPIPPTAQAPATVPQQPESQLTFPATATGPRYDTSGYVPPASYRPAAVAPPVPAYQTATAPRYLPPVPSATPGAVVR
jgi:tetratricopeptide (TPR) repeat protein